MSRRAAKTAACGNPGCREPVASRCSACLVTRYCSPACQHSHWPAHKASCKEWRAAKKASAVAVNDSDHKEECVQDAVELDDADLPPPPPPQGASAAQIRGAAATLSAVCSAADMAAINASDVAHLVIARFLSPAGDMGVGLTVNYITQEWVPRSAPVASGRWRAPWGTWDAPAWVRFVACAMLHLGLKRITTLQLVHKVQDRPRKGFVAALTAALPVLAADPEFTRLKLGSVVVNNPVQERVNDFALQFDLHYFRRGLGYGLRVPDRRAAPAATYTSGMTGYIVRDSEGRIFKSVEAYLSARVAAASGPAEAKPKLLALLAELRRGTYDGRRDAVQWNQMVTEAQWGGKGLTLDEAAELASVVLLLPLREAAAYAEGVGARPPVQDPADACVPGLPVSVARFAAAEALISRAEGEGRLSPGMRQAGAAMRGAR